MKCLAMLSSGNYVFALYNILEKKGYVFEVVSTPCHIAKGGCGYCLKFPIEYMDLVISEGRSNTMPVMEVYKVIPQYSKNKYERIY